jgi:hypothetical protein
MCRRCHCHKWINGVLGPVRPLIRWSAETRSWEKAEELKPELEADFEGKQIGDSEVRVVAPEKISVKDAVS